MDVSPRATILIFEDEYAVVDFAQAVLEAEGFRVRQSADGRSGLSSATELVPGLIVLDLMLPLMDGVDVLVALRRATRTSEVPVIVYSAAPALLPADQRRKVRAVLPKPIDLGRLVLAVGDALNAA